MAVATRIDRDDVLFEIEGADMALAVVHLTWRKGIRSALAYNKILRQLGTAVRDEMLPAHQEYSS